MNVPDYYQQLNVEAGKIQNSTFSDSDTLASHITSHGFLHDYSTFLNIINHRYESSIFELALKEYQYALFALSSGQYRHAYVGLRLFFEMTLATFHFSANELDFRLWESDRKDINWRTLIDEDNGIFSKTYGRAFNESLIEHVKAFNGITQNVYRECSEYVHGNLHTHHTIPKNIEYKKEICLDWHNKAKTMHLVILYLFSIRYLPNLNSEDKAKAEPIIMSELSHIAELRNQF